MTVQFDGMSSHEMVAAAVVERIFNEGSPRKRMVTVDRDTIGEFAGRFIARTDAQSKGLVDRDGSSRLFLGRLGYVSFINGLQLYRAMLAKKREKSGNGDGASPVMQAGELHLGYERFLEKLAIPSFVVDGDVEFPQMSPSAPLMAQGLHLIGMDWRDFGDTRLNLDGSVIIDGDFTGLEWPHLHAVGTEFFQSAFDFATIESGSLRGAKFLDGCSAINTRFGVPMDDADVTGLVVSEDTSFAGDSAHVSAGIVVGGAYRYHQLTLSTGKGMGSFVMGHMGSLPIQVGNGLARTVQPVHVAGLQTPFTYGAALQAVSTIPKI